MFAQALLPDTLRAVKAIADYPEIKEAYLAGGTALALQLGHRISVDLDFFTFNEFDEQVMARRLEQIPEFKLDGMVWRTVWGKIGETKFSMFYYKYNIIDPYEHFERLSLLGKKDIAAMKVRAVSERGAKRDFVDLYFLAKEYGVDQMLNFYEQKYSGLEEHLYSIIKALNYFEEADLEQMPDMLIQVDWEEIKNYFSKESLRLAKKYLNV